MAECSSSEAASESHGPPLDNIPDEGRPGDEPTSSEQQYTYDAETGAYMYTDQEGTMFQWDPEKKAWFPKVDEEFLARYQLSYGFHADGSVNPSPVAPPSEDPGPAKKKKKAAGGIPQPQPAGWFEVDETQNRNVYVSGLPPDVTHDEFVELIQKCGLVAKDPDSGELKAKIYTDDQGTPKGDGRCTYIRVESVSLALQILDGSDIRGHTIHVERAQFKPKGEYNPSLRPRKKKRRDKEKFQKSQERLLDWRPDRLRGQRSRHESIVVLKHVFRPSEIEKDAALILELKQDIREECTKFGKLKKVVLHDRHPEGVVQLYYAEPEEADTCIEALHGRWFGGLKLEAETWDGRTKYRIEETAEEKEKRLKTWDSYLVEPEQAANDTDDKKQETTSQASTSAS